MSSSRDLWIGVAAWAAIVACAVLVGVSRGLRLRRAQAASRRHAGPRCSFCGRALAEGHDLVGGPEAFVCEACVFGALAAITQQRPGDAAGSAFRAIDAILSALPSRVPYAALEPLLDAALRVARTSAERHAVCLRAHAHEHFERALAILRAFPELDRPLRWWLDVAALLLVLERFDEAAQALDSARALGAAGDPFFECHCALLDAHLGRTLDEPALLAVVASARGVGQPTLVAEALKATARHRALRGDLAGALAALDEAIATAPDAATWRVVVELCRACDPARAHEAWRAALACTHPESHHARRLRQQPHGSMHEARATRG